MIGTTQRLLTAIAFTLSCLSIPLMAQEEELISGFSKAVQEGAQIVQNRGMDQQVDYKSLTKYGPWDDRNYTVTRADLALIPENDQYLSNVPLFFKVFKRKQQPQLGEFYPRSTFQHFLILHGGPMVNGRLYKEGLGMGYHGQTSVVARAAENEIVLDLNVMGNEVSVEANPLNKNEVVAGSNRAGGQTMYFSSDGGLTWNLAQTNPSSCCDPTIAWSSDGSKVYQADLSSSIGVRWAISNDKGKSWGPMQVLTSSGSDKEFLHVDHSATSPHLDNIYLTYHNHNVMQFARSTDFGASFSTPISFNAEPRGIGSDITTDAAGNIYYFYPSFNDGIRLLKSTDGGVSFNPGTQVAALKGRFDFPIPAMEEREAFIYVSADYDEKSDDIYVAWTDEADDSVGGGNGSAARNHGWIQVAKSTNGGTTWAVLPHPHDATDLISGTPIDRFHPWISVEDGVVHIVYYDTRHSPDRSGVDLYYTFWKTGGTSWEPEQRFTTETSVNLTDGQEWGDYNGLSVVLDNLVASWTDNRPSTASAPLSDKAAMVGRQDVVLEPDVATVASLHVEAVGHQSQAGPGNTQPASLVVAVNDASGPVTGLTAANFKVDTNPMPPGSCAIEINRVVSTTKGAYLLDVSPIATPGCAWKTGTYSIAVLVKDDAAAGVGVVNLEIKSAASHPNVINSSPDRNGLK